MGGTESYFGKKVLASCLLIQFSVVACVAQTNNKFNYGILFDNTGSMFSQIPRQQQISKEVGKKTKETGLISIFGFAQDTTSQPSFSRLAVGIECETSAEVIEKQINEINVARGQTTLIDAIQAAVNRLKNPVASKCGKSDQQILIVMTDGEDRASLTSAKDLNRFVKSSGVKVYIIALLDDLPKERGFIAESAYKKSKEFLVKLASETAGRIVIAEKKQKAEEIVSTLFSESYRLPK